MDDPIDDETTEKMKQYLESELLSDHFKEVIQRLLELDGGIIAGEMILPPALDIVLLIESWYDPPSDEELTIN